MSTTNQQAIAALVDALAAVEEDDGTPTFAAVTTADPDRLADAAAAYPRAEILPVGWARDDQWSPILDVVKLTFQAVITTRATATDDPDADLDRLIRRVERAVAGGRFGDDCLPALSSIEHGKYTRFGGGTTRLDTAAQPGERRAWLEGSVSYLQ
jgi:hypothetical protein